MSTNGHADEETEPDLDEIGSHIVQQELNQSQLNRLAGALEESIGNQEQILKKQTETHDQLSENPTDEDLLAEAGRVLLRERATRNTSSDTIQDPAHAGAKALYSSIMLAGGIVALLGFIISLLWVSPVVSLVFLLASGFFAYAARSGVP